MGGGRGGGEGWRGGTRGGSREGEERVQEGAARFELAGSSLQEEVQGRTQTHQDSVWVQDDRTAVGAAERSQAGGRSTSVARHLHQLIPAPPLLA